MPSDLFSHAATRDRLHQPLAERMRPRCLDEVRGQDALLGEHGPLRRLLRRQAPLACILLGPPGVGKTTLGRLCASELQADFVAMSAVSAGMADLRHAVDQARTSRDHHRRKTLLFVDEIHRFHRGQQDALLPHVESGLFAFVGATTEHPRFSLTRALLSRCRLFDLQPVDDDAIAALCASALTDEVRGLGASCLAIAAEAQALLSRLAGGDARRALGLLEGAAHLAEDEQASVITPYMLHDLLEHSSVPHDRAQDSHYDVASALIKSMRASDEQASTYYLARMVEGGESLEFVLRRLSIFASEDVGLADPQAIVLVGACAHSAERVGLPEAWYPLVHATLYLARAPKSQAVGRARDVARRWVSACGAVPPPSHLCNEGSHEHARQGASSRASPLGRLPTKLQTYLQQSRPAPGNDDPSP